MLTYDLRTSDTAPLFEKLYRALRGDILGGMIPTGEKLPSKRALARHLGVSVITVENAYEQLVAEGYITSRERSGYYVSPIGPRPPVRAVSPRSDEPAPRVKPVPPRPRPAFTLGDPGIPRGLFPFSVWSKLTRSVLSAQDDRLLERVPYNGAPQLREAIAGHLLRFRGLRVDPERIVIGAGTEYLQGLLIRLLGNDRIYAVEDPGYRKIGRIYEANGVPCRRIGLDESGLDPSLLRETGADVIHITPSHHFPTGIVMPIARRQELLSWASEVPDRFILEDEYDSEFRYSGRPIPTMQSIDAHGRVIYLNSFTKTISPSMRISYMVLPEELNARFREALGFYACTVSGFEQYTLAEFISKGFFDRHINRMKKHYRDMRDLTVRLIEASPLREKAVIEERSAGLHLILRLGTNKTEEALRHDAQAKGLLLEFVSDHATGPAEAFTNCVLVHYAGIDPEAFGSACEVLAAVL